MGREEKVLEEGSTGSLGTMLGAKCWALWRSQLLGMWPLKSPSLQVFGLGSVAHMVLDEKHGSYLGVNIGFGFGVTMGAHVAGNISGK